jgi:serine/threonine-protein kinase
VLGGLDLVRALEVGRGPTFAARMKREDGATDLVVVERFPRGEDAHVYALVRAGKRLVLFNHPNVPRVKALEVTAEEVLFVSELVDAERYDVLATAAADGGRPMPLNVHLRVLIDILAGLTALHLLRDSDGPLGLYHGEVCPAYVLLGTDGNARIAHVARKAGEPSSASTAYVAPEVRLGDTADHRADVYSCGVMLWEALAGRRLFNETSGILPKQLSDRLEPAPVPAGQAWAAPLSEIAARALAADPGARYPTAAELAGDLRKVVGARVALKSSLASLVTEVCGDRIGERRRGLVATGSAPVMKAVDTPPRIVPAEVLARALEIGEDETTRQQAIPPQAKVPQKPKAIPQKPKAIPQKPKTIPQRPKELELPKKPIAVDLPPSAIVTPPPPSERDSIDDETTRELAAQRPTSPFAFVMPPTAAVRSTPPPPEAPVAHDEGAPERPSSPRDVVPAATESGPLATALAPQPRRSLRGYVLGAMLAAVLVLTIAGIRGALRGKEDAASRPAPRVAPAAPSALPEAPTARTAPTVPAVPAAPVAHASTTPSASTRAVPSATAPEQPRPRVTRPKPTFDPQGI